MKLLNVYVDALYFERKTLMMTSTFVPASQYLADVGKWSEESVVRVIMNGACSVPYVFVQQLDDFVDSTLELVT